METIWLWVIIAGIAGLVIGAALMYAFYVSKVQQRMQGYARVADEKSRQLEATGDRVQSVESELLSREAELKESRDRLQAAESGIEEERVKAQGLNQTVERMGGQVRDYEDKMRAAESELATVGNERAQQEKELERLRQQWQDEHRKVEALDARLKAAEKDRRDLELKLDQVEKKRRSVLDTVKRTLSGEREEEPVEMQNRK